MNYASLHPYFKRLDVQINYLYYEFTGRREDTDSFKHALHSNKIIQRLQEKNYTLHKDDIIYLLKEDGAHFFHDSLRIYDPKEESYFRVTDDWEFSVAGDQDVKFSLLFYIKTTYPNLKSKIDDINDEIKKMRERIFARMSGLEEKVKFGLDTMSTEIDRLKLSSKVISDQLSTIRDNNHPLMTAVELPALDSKMASELSQNSSAGTAEAYNKTTSNDSIYKCYKQGVELRLQDIDIALMYSEPLVRRDGKGIYSLGDPVDYEEECNKLLEILNKKEKKINLYFEIATIKNLVNVLSLSPTVLHIICHGDFNKNKNQFFLCFEENGELIELYSEDLKSRLQAFNFSTQLVFINACHSEEVAKVFMDAGVPCVVAVHSELKIEDSIAQKFSESFYWQLFEGKSIEQAFRSAQVSIAGNNVYTCCCAHSHKADCEWYKLAKNEGYEKAHYLHTPTCGDCSKKFGNSFKHKMNCKWATDFMVFICENLDLPLEDFHVCCCSPELEHNETMKFKLICREERVKEQILFRYKDSGEVTITSTHSCVEPKFLISKMAGRNQEIYEMFSLLRHKEKKIVNLYGVEGVGKTNLAKQVANYMVERGHFREKVCHISLENIPSMTYFRSNLCKELPGSYDAKTLCQSIKNSRMLFILEKCDKIVNEYCEQFVQDLAYMLVNAPNVKFIITTTQKINLKLGEHFVEMKQLEKLDAAKLLYKHASAHLNFEERNVYKLADHEIFNLIPLTPQGIWSIAEKLKSSKSLNEIKLAFAQEKAKCDQNSQKSKIIEETIMETIGKMQESSPDTYNLLTFMYLFPSGLSYQDLEELSLKGKIPADWKTLLLHFLYTRAFSNLSNQAQPEAEELELEDLLEVPKFKRNDSIFRKGRIIERKDFKPDNYLWMNIIKDPTDNELWFLPAQFLTKCIEKHLGGRIGEQILKKLEYMSTLAYTLIEIIKINNDYIEKILECSAVCNYGFWRNPEREILDQNSIRYINEAEYDFNKLKRLFEAHELNFFSCLEPETMNLVYKRDYEKIDHVLNVIEAISLGVPTLFKVMSVKDSGTMEVARKTDQMLKNLGGANQKLVTIRIKVNLFLVALYLASKSEMVDNFLVAKIQLNMIQDQEARVKDPELRPQILSEIAFARAIHFYKGYKYNCLKSSEFQSKFSFFQEVRNLLKKAQTSLEPLLQKDDKFKVTKAKITLVQTKTKYNRQIIEKKLLEDMFEAMNVLKEYGALGLEMKANYLYACLRLEHEKANMQFKNLDNMTPNMKNMTNNLVKVKNVHLIEKALQIAKQIKASLYESKINRKIDDINVEIQRTYFNVIVIMQAAPRVDIKQQGEELNDSQIIPIEYPTKLVSTFKDDLFQVLKKAKKTLYLKFETLTKKVLTESLVNGCRVLQLCCSKIEEDCICIEGPYGATERISFDELREIFSPEAQDPHSSTSNLVLTAKEAVMRTTSIERSLTSGNTTMAVLQETTIETTIKEEINESRESVEILTRTSVQEKSDFESKQIEILILANRYNQKLIDLFIQLEIPHVITFEFTSNEEPDLMQKTIENECIERFCISFYEELVSYKSISTAFDIAYLKAFDYLSKKYFENKPQSQIREIIGPGPLLFPKDEEHQDHLFGLGKFWLADGRVENISNSHCPTNISEMLIPYTGRNKEIYEILRRAHQYRGFLEIIGAPGVGKTTFVLQIAYDILNRNLFPDGVFYIPLKKLKYNMCSQYQMEDLVRDILGLEVQVTYKNFFKAKNMLLIFDDFDLVYAKDIEFPSLLFLSLEECQIPSIIVTSSENIDLDSEEADKKLLNVSYKLYLKGLLDEELALMLQSVIEIKSNKDLINLEELKNCTAVKEAGGRPKCVVEKLLDRKIIISQQVLTPNPAYEKLLHFEDSYICDLEPNSRHFLPFTSQKSKERVAGVSYSRRVDPIGYFNQLKSHNYEDEESQRSERMLDFPLEKELEKSAFPQIERQSTSARTSKKVEEGKNSDASFKNELQENANDTYKEERIESHGQEKEETPKGFTITTNAPAIFNDEGKRIVEDLEKKM